MTRDTDTTDDRTDHDNPRDSPDGPPDAPAGHSESDTRSTPAEAAADPEGILTPADLERVAEQVLELDDERVLVPTDGTDPTSEPTTADPPSETGRSRRPGQGSRTERGADSPDPLADATGDPTTSAGSDPEQVGFEAETAYAVDVTVKTEHGVAADSFRSNDIRTVFESFLRWYAGRIDPDADPATVVRVLLSASDLDVEVR